MKDKDCSGNRPGQEKKTFFPGKKHITNEFAGRLLPTPTLKINMEGKYIVDRRKRHAIGYGGKMTIDKEQ
jgi:hypothetical protein